MSFPLTNEEMKSIQEIKKKFEKSQTAYFTQLEYQKWQDMLYLMQTRDLIRSSNTLSGMQFSLLGDFSIFEKWVCQENKKAKEMKRREWRIAIISAIIGAIGSHLPTIIQWIGGLINGN